MRPSWITVVNTPSKPPFVAAAYTIPPVRIPINSEEYTSLVIRASPIAIIGGSSDQSDPIASVIGA